jgi:hypothetical protein
MKYLDFLFTLDIIYRHYPRYHTNDILLLADDILKWFNHELPEDSSTLIYLKHYYSSPTEALQSIWKEIQLMASPHLFVN